MPKKIFDASGEGDSYDTKVTVDKQQADTDSLHGDGLFPLKNSAGLISNNGECVTQTGMDVGVKDLLALVDGFRIGNKELTDAVKATATVPTADATDPRIDVVVVKVKLNLDGKRVKGDTFDAEVIAGTPDSTLNLGSITDAEVKLKANLIVPAGSVAVCAVKVAAGVTSIVAGDLVDNRDYLIDVDDIVAAASLVEKRVTSLEGRVTTLEADFTSVSGELTNISAQVTGNTANLTVLGDQILNIGSQVINLSGNIANLGQDLLGLQNSVASFSAQQVSNTAQISSLGVQLTSLSVEVTSLGDQITVLDTQDVNFATDLASLTTDLSNLNAQFTTIQTEIVALTSRVDSLETRVGDLETTSSALSTSLSTLSAAVTGNTADLTTLSADVANQATQILSLGGAVLDLGQELTNTNTNVSLLGEQQDTNIMQLNFLGTQLIVLAGDITYLGNQVDALDTQDVNFATDLADLNTQLVALDTQVTNNITEIVSLKSRVDSLESRMSTVESNFATLSTGLDALSTDVTGLTADLNTLDSDVINQGLLITTLEASILSLSQEVTSLNTNVVSLGTQQTTNTNQLAFLSSQLTSVSTQVGSIADQVAALDTQDGNFATDLAALASQLTALNSQFTTLNEEVISLSSRVNSLETRVLILESDFSTLDSDLVTLSAAVTGLTADLDTLDADVTSIAIQVQYLGSEVSDLGSEVSVLNNEQSLLSTQQILNTSQISFLGAQLTSLSAQITSLGVDIDALDTQDVNFATDLASLTTQLTTLTAEFVALSVEVTTLSTQSSTLNTQVQNLAQQHTTDVIGLDSRIDALESAPAPQGTDLISQNKVLNWDTDIDVGASSGPYTTEDGGNVLTLSPSAGAPAPFAMVNYTGIIPGLADGSWGFIILPNSIYPGPQPLTKELVVIGFAYDATPSSEALVMPISWDQGIIDMRTIWDQTNNPLLASEFMRNGTLGGDINAIQTLTIPSYNAGSHYRSYYTEFIYELIGTNNDGSALTIRMQAVQIQAIQVGSYAFGQIYFSVRKFTRMKPDGSFPDLTAFDLIAPQGTKTISNSIPASNLLNIAGKKVRFGLSLKSSTSDENYDSLDFLAEDVTGAPVTLDTNTESLTGIYKHLWKDALDSMTANYDSVRAKVTYNAKFDTTGSISSVAKYHGTTMDTGSIASEAIDTPAIVITNAIPSPDKLVSLIYNLKAAAKPGNTDVKISYSTDNGSSYTLMRDMDGTNADLLVRKELGTSFSQTANTGLKLKIELINDAGDDTIKPSIDKLTVLTDNVAAQSDLVALANAIKDAGTFADLQSTITTYLASGA